MRIERPTALRLLIPRVMPALGAGTPFLLWRRGRAVDGRPSPAMTERGLGDRARDGDALLCLSLKEANAAACMRCGQELGDVEILWRAGARRNAVRPDHSCVDAGRWHRCVANLRHFAEGTARDDWWGRRGRRSQSRRGLRLAFVSQRVSLPRV